MYSALVVGAGPAGSSCAYFLKKNGFDCAIIEKNESIGKSACGGLISRSGIENLGLKLDEEVIINKIKGAIIHSKTVNLFVERDDFVAYVIDREKFDNMLVKRAKSIGVDVFLNTKLLDIRNEKVFVEKEGRGELIKAEFFVGADGAVSKTREILGIKTSFENFVEAYQVIAEGSFDHRYVEIFFCEQAKNFFAWVIPESKSRARIGIASSSYNSKEALESFMEEKGFTLDVISKNAGLIPIGPPLKKPFSDRIFLLGDAAFHTKATTGGGILSSVEAAKILSSTIINFYKNKRPTTEYEKNLTELYKDLEIHWRIRKYANSLSLENLDKIFAKAKKAGIEEFLVKEGDMDKPSKFINKIWFKPSLWSLIPDFLKI